MVLQGIDISGWQRGIDLAAVPADFVIIKATGGTGFTSSACEAQYQAAKGAGKLRGVYHFAREQGYAGSAVEEADYFVSETSGYLRDPETLLVLDWEGDNVADTVWAKSWLDRVRLRTGKVPLIYMSHSTATRYDWSDVARAGYGLWISAYVLGDQRINGYAVPEGLLPVHAWPFIAMHQFTASGRLPGWNGDLDLDVFFGDRAAWLKYAAGDRKPASVPPSVVPRSYTVRAGDTLDGIARGSGTDWPTLARLNGLANPDLIHPGQVLRLP
ncbi:GH25 family lysozyme [Arthrobacter sp. NPDC090010]|uniref:GH25 family lysozyme n=1 Tax=Arthrobacter sp. NPDC090010 TaxID=3363942 RepID=UPI0037FCA369